jgi:hypothetical protein
MVRRSFTAVVERNATFTSDFATEPYETGWASKARWFIRVLEIEGSLKVRPQISPDGQVWCDEGHGGVAIDASGLYSFALTDFGHWLRLAGSLAGANASTTVIVYLALKE